MRVWNWKSGNFLNHFNMDFLSNKECFFLEFALFIWKEILIKMIHEISGFPVSDLHFWRPYLSLRHQYFHHWLAGVRNSPWFHWVVGLSQFSRRGQVYLGTSKMRVWNWKSGNFLNRFNKDFLSNKECFFLEFSLFIWKEILINMFQEIFGFPVSDLHFWRP